MSKLKNIFEILFFLGICLGICFVMLSGLWFFINTFIQDNKIDCYEKNGEWVELSWAADNCLLVENE